MDKKVTAEKALGARITAIRDMNPPGTDLTTQINQATARNVVLEELGQFDARLPSYSLDQETRDLLLVNAREDAAHAVINTIDLMKSLSKLSNQVKLLRLTLIIIAIGYALWVCWPYVIAVIGHS